MVRGGVSGGVLFVTVRGGVMRKAELRALSSRVRERVAALRSDVVRLGVEGRYSRLS
jgi:hypothetical protein